VHPVWPRVVKCWSLQTIWLRNPPARFFDLFSLLAEDGSLHSLRAYRVSIVVDNALFILEMVIIRSTGEIADPAAR